MSLSPAARRSASWTTSRPKTIKLTKRQHGQAPLPPDGVVTHGDKEVHLSKKLQETKESGKTDRALCGCI